MARALQIKGRIKSVSKIHQITKAMEKVAASKMRRAEAATLRSRTYAIAAREILHRLFQLTNPAAHPLFAQRSGQKRLLILFSSDRGLAGAYNSNLFRAFLNEITPESSAPSVIAVGQKGIDFTTRLGSAVELLGAYPNWPVEPSVTDVQPIAKSVLEGFTQAAWDKVDLLYTDFLSISRQQVVTKPLLPVQPETVSTDRIGQDILDAAFEPSAKAVLNFIVPRLLEVQIYQASLEAIASEHAMRMLAMKNASDNAEEIADDLRLIYNRARQSSITQELAEISAGAAAVQS